MRQGFGLFKDLIGGQAHGHWAKHVCEIHLNPKSSPPDCSEATSPHDETLSVDIHRKTSNTCFGDCPFRDKWCHLVLLAMEGSTCWSLPQDSLEVVVLWVENNHLSTEEKGSQRVGCYFGKLSARAKELNASIVSSAEQFVMRVSAEWMNLFHNSQSLTQNWLRDEQHSRLIDMCLWPISHSHLVFLHQLILASHSQL